MNRAHVGNVFWSGLEAASSAALSFASAFVVARLVGPSEVGIGAAAVALHVLLWVVVNALFADALVQRLTLDDATFSSAFWASILIGGFAAILLLAIGQPIARWLDDARLVPMSAMLLHGAGAYRGRVMGMRMLAIYGLPIGLLSAGALIERIGFAQTATLYCSVGILLTLVIALHWRTALWPLHAPANAR